MTSPEQPPVSQPPEPVVDETLTPLEAAFYTLLLAVFAAWLKRVAARVMQPWRLWKMAPDPQGVWAESESWNRNVQNLTVWLDRNAASHGWDRFDDGDPGPYPSSDAFIQAHLARVANYLVRIPDEIYQGIFAAISEGVNEGESVEQIAERVEKMLTISGSENWPNRAQVISITEVNGASNAGWMAAAIQTQQIVGRQLHKRWIATRDRATRASHRQANGQVRLLTEPFIVGGFPLLYPGDKTGPPHEVINCVTGDSLVHVPDIQRALRFQYDGPIFTLRGQRGLRGTVSPYHPILTEHGWVPACEINKGDHVLCALDWYARALPDVKSPPSEAQDVYDSLAQSVTAHRVKAIGVDFHGDRPQGDVNVVLADRILALPSYSEHEQLREEFLFALANSPNASHSPLFHVGDGMPTPPGGIMSRLGLLRAFVERHPGPLEPLGFTASSNLQAHFPEAQIDSSPVDTEMSREAFDRFAAAVSFDQIVKVDVTTYHGYLYSFETKTGIYIADGTITHNCRCAAATEGA